MRAWRTTGGCAVRRIVAGRGNAYLLANGPDTLLFDTSRRGSRGRLLARLREAGAARLGAVVLSHTHFDHAENAATVRARCGARVVVHAAEAAGLREGINPPTGGTNPPARVLARLLNGPLRARFAYDPCAADIAVADRLDLGPFGFDAFLLHTPGHTLGSLALVLEDELALVGDTLFGVLPGAAFPPFAVDVDLLIESWGRLLDTPCRVFLPGHGRPIGRGLLELCYRRRRPAAAGHG